MLVVILLSSGTWRRRRRGTFIDSSVICEELYTLLEAHTASGIKNKQKTNQAGQTLDPEFADNPSDITLTVITLTVTCSHSKNYHL